jgi:hypothetical protein
MSSLDMTALGRQEEWEDSPEGYPQSGPYQWWNWQDAYGETGPFEEGPAAPRLTPRRPMLDASHYKA